jgi:hypothetical protein
MSTRAQNAPDGSAESHLIRVGLPPAGKVLAPDVWETALDNGYTVRVVVGNIDGAPAATSITLSSATRPVTATAWRKANPGQRAVDAIRALGEAAYASSVPLGRNLGHVISDVERDEQGRPVIGPDGRPRAETRYSPQAPPTEWWKAREQYWSKVRARLDQRAKVPLAARPGAGRPRRTDDFFRGVAEAYLEAVAHGYNVHRHVAKCLFPNKKVTTATVKRWAAEAEGRGYLAEALPGKPRTRGVML